MDKLYSVEEMARLTDLSDRRIRQLADELINAGLAQKVGSVLVLYAGAAKYISTRTHKPRGRPKKKK